ncbi:MAG: holin family protein [Amaricoccus sp.]
MGMIGTILGAGGAVRQAGEAVSEVAGVFVGSEAEREAAASKQALAAVGEFGAEFALPAQGPFDGFVNGLNRLPRPLLALSTIGLFVYAMAAPAGFSVRMQGLALVPEPLWWLLGAIVSFYFGARELHHQRMRQQVTLGVAAAQRAVAAIRPTPVADPAAPEPAATPMPVAARMPVAAAPKVAPEPLAIVPPAAVADPDYNAAVEEWRRLQG